MKRLACHLIFAGALAAQSPCSIRGIVVDAFTAQPLAKAEIFADSEDDSALPVRRITDSQGAFCFAALTAGNYRVRAKRAGYIDASFGEKRPVGRGQILQVTEHEPFPPLSMKMTPGAAISGSLVDEDGDPVQAARISLLQPRWKGGRLEPASVQQTMTDDQGRYRFAGLTTGTYFLMATPARGSEWPLATNFLDQNGQSFRQVEGSTYYQDSRSFPAATPIRLRAGQELNHLTLTLAQTGARHVSGQVPAEVLNTTPRVLYISAEADEGPPILTTVPIQNDGGFLAEGLFPGRYLLRGPFVREEIDLTRGDVDGLTIEPFDAVEVWITLHLDGARSDPKCSLTGGLRLVPKSSDPDLANQATDTERTSENKFRAVVLPGQYELGPAADGPACFVKRMLVNGIMQPGRTFEIKKGAATSINLFLSAHVASIDGRVTAAHELTNGITMLLQSELEQDSPAEQPVGVDGKFHWNFLNPGKYRLYAFEDFDREAWGNPQLAVLLASQSMAIEIKESEHLRVTVPLISAEDFQEALRKTAF